MADRAWHEIVRDVLKQHNVNLVPYLLDHVLRPLIDLLREDFFSMRSRSPARKKAWASRAAPGWPGPGRSC